MAQFSYKARSLSGHLLEGQLEAVSAAGAADQLVASGVTPVAIQELTVRNSLFGPLTLRLASLQLGRVDIDDLILFCRQMHTLIKAGVPMLRALRGLSEMIRKQAMADTLQAVTEDLESGRDLSSALRRHPKVFPPLLVSMVQVGEGSGQLEEAFLQISRYLIREKETADQIRSAMRYPTFVLVAISIAIAVITLFVIPAFEKLYRGAGVTLPLPTRIILGVSNFAVAWWWAILLGGIAAMLAWRAYLGTQAGRLAWDRFKLRLPVIGSILHRATLIRFCRGFAMGYGAGVPLIQSLAVTAQAVGNAFIEQRLGRLRHSVERGDTLTRSAAASEMFTPLVLQMLAVGEETGSVDSMLVEVAEFYEREVEYDVSRLASTIEPVLIVVIGGMVLVLALGVFLPMWDLASIARGGANCMQPKNPTHQCRWVLRLFEWTVVVSVICILSIIFIQRLERIQAHLEMRNWEATLQALQAAVFLAATIGPQALAADDNPVTVYQQQFGDLPANYLGELDSVASANAPRGSWYFVRQQKMLFYKVTHPDGFNKLSEIQMQMVYEEGSKRLHLKVLQGTNGCL